MNVGRGWLAATNMATPDSGSMTLPTTLFMLLVLCGFSRMARSQEVSRSFTGVTIRVA